MEYSIVISQKGLAIWQHGKGGAECALNLPADDEQAGAKLHGWLMGHRRCRAIVADFAEERHALERLPRASRADRRELVRRKLAQHFPDAAHTGAFPLPDAAQEGGGLFETVLFSSLPRSPLMALCLDALVKAGMQGKTDIPCLTSMPFLLERWYCRQPMLPPQGLLLVVEPDGMRQIFFRQRRLVFSRVIPARSAALAGNVPAYRDELSQTLGWLAAQRLADAPPPILVLAPAADFPLLLDLAPSTGSRMDFIDLTQCPGGGAGVLALALQETRRHGLPHYGCPALRPPRQLALARRAVWALAFTMLAAGGLAAASEFASAGRLREETQRFAAERQRLQIELEKLEAQAADKRMPVREEKEIAP